MDLEDLRPRRRRRGADQDVEGPPVPVRFMWGFHLIEALFEGEDAEQIRQENADWLAFVLRRLRSAERAFERVPEDQRRYTLRRFERRRSPEAHEGGPIRRPYGQRVRVRCDEAARRLEAADQVVSDFLFDLFWLLRSRTLIRH